MLSAAFSAAGFYSAEQQAILRRAQEVRGYPSAAAFIRAVIFDGETLTDEEKRALEAVTPRDD